MDTWLEPFHTLSFDPALLAVFAKRAVGPDSIISTVLTANDCHILAQLNDALGDG